MDVVRLVEDPLLCMKEFDRHGRPLNWFDGVPFEAMGKLAHAMWQDGPGPYVAWCALIRGDEFIVVKSLSEDESLRVTVALDSPAEMLACFRRLDLVEPFCVGWRDLVSVHLPKGIRQYFSSTFRDCLSRLFCPLNEHGQRPLHRDGGHDFDPVYEWLEGRPEIFSPHVCYIFFWAMLGLPFYELPPELYVPWEEMKR